MRKFCFLLAALAMGSHPAFAQTGTAATTASVESTAGQKPATKRVCKRVADVGSLVAKKVCRVVEVEAKPSAIQPAGQRSAGAPSANED